MFTQLKKGPKVGIYIVSAGFKDISVLCIKHGIQQQKLLIHALLNIHKYSIMWNPSYIDHSLFLASYLNGKHPWLNICLFFQTIQIWWAMHQSQSRSWMSMTMPPILPQTALWLCVKAPRQARLVISSHLISSLLLFSYPISAPFMFSQTIFFSYFNSVFLFTHMYEHTHSHVH